MKNENKATAFIKMHLLDDIKYADIAAKLDVARPQLTTWWEEEAPLRARIAKSNQLFSSKKSQKDDDFKAFAVLGKRRFFEWYDAQARVCYYCGIEENKLEKLFNYDNPILSTKRGRGRTLELERRDSETNAYSPDNCVLACYVCNNHKSDLISEEDHVKYFADAIKEYLEAKLNIN